mmetsp:Transcript_56357/g.174832  ORF Transcript_56357/g.174832 Transcript_56357/m.174832 type:complete len:275 (+) Transcript_56357:355-1179(+)
MAAANCKSCCNEKSVSRWDSPGEATAKRLFQASHPSTGSSAATASTDPHCRRRRARQAWTAATYASIARAPVSSATLTAPPSGPSKWYTSLGLSASSAVCAIAARRKQAVPGPARGDATTSSTRAKADASRTALSIACSPKSESAVTSTGHSDWICCQMAWSSAGTDWTCRERSTAAATRHNAKAHASGARRRSERLQLEPPGPGALTSSSEASEDAKTPRRPRSSAQAAAAAASTPRPTSAPCCAAALWPAEESAVSRSAIGGKAAQGRGMDI